MLRTAEGGLALDAHEAETVEEGLLRFRTPLGRHVGCRHLEQRVLELQPGRLPERSQRASEEVLYVVRGRGQLVLDGQAHALEPDTAAFVPAGSRHQLVNPGPGELVLVSVLSPPPGQPSPPRAPAGLPAGGRRTVHISEEEDIPAGDDRYFRLLIDPRYGCGYMTQFVGFISHSRAPLHTHTYEEAIYILEGSTTVHMGSESHRVEAGGSIYLPPGLAHCLENSRSETLRLLGVFCPAGDPGSRREQDASGS